ncbi:MAG: CoA transferase [Rubrivivax sp.]|jgi:crotonobetainyl-CoA:carnitine CoA-transferase CaiB-like acyl-CoA transferase
MTPPSEATGTRPLAGVKGVEIEPPEGHAMRTRPPLSGGCSEIFTSLNRGRQSIALDLKQPADRAAARCLAREADVVVDNGRPGTLQRLGPGRDWFQPRGPSSVYRARRRRRSAGRDAQADHLQRVPPRELPGGTKSP